MGSHEPSISVFKAHIERVQQPDGSVVLIGDGVISRACYEHWLATRGQDRGEIENPEKVFQRTLTGCLTAADGRRPFDADEEAAVLLTIRQKRVWPAFQGSDITIGARGFRSMGFHEHRTQSAAACALPPAASSSPPPRPQRKRARKAARATSADDLRRAELTAGVITPSVSPAHWAEEAEELSSS